MMQTVMTSSVKGSVITVLKAFLKRSHWGLQSQMRYLDARFFPHGKQGSWDFSCSGGRRMKEQLRSDLWTGLAAFCIPSSLFPGVSCDTTWPAKKGTDWCSKKGFPRTSSLHACIQVIILWTPGRERHKPMLCSFKADHADSCNRGTRAFRDQGRERYSDRSIFTQRQAALYHLVEFRSESSCSSDFPGTISGTHAGQVRWFNRHKSAKWSIWLSPYRDLSPVLEHQPLSWSLLPAVNKVHQIDPACLHRSPFVHAT